MFLPPPHCQEMYSLCLAPVPRPPELHRLVIEIQLSELDGDGEVGRSFFCDSPKKKKVFIQSGC